MDTIKEAADSLLNKNQITSEEYEMLKEAGIFEMKKEALKGNKWLRRIAKAKAIGKMMVGIGKPTLIAGAAGVVGKEIIADPIIESRKINKSFDLMQEKVPQLAEKNKDDLKDYFEVVKTFSPKAASNPLVAGALVNKMIEFGGVDHKLVQDIAAIEMGLARPSVIRTGLESAAKGVGGAKID